MTSARVPVHTPLFPQYPWCLVHGTERAPRASRHLALDRAKGRPGRLQPHLALLGGRAGKRRRLAGTEALSEVVFPFFGSKLAVQVCTQKASTISRVKSRRVGPLLEAKLEGLGGGLGLPTRPLDGAEAQRKTQARVRALQSDWSRRRVRLVAMDASASCRRSHSGRLVGCSISLTISANGAGRTTSPRRTTLTWLGFSSSPVRSITGWPFGR